jgi:hypothetical protein
VVGEELPAAAAARMAGNQASGTWGSALTSGEFAAIRSVGFEPVGQVFGAAVFGVAVGSRKAMVKGRGGTTTVRWGRWCGPWIKPGGRRSSG